jgi:integrase
MTAAAAEVGSVSRWSGLYGERHRMHRVTQFPQGVSTPAKVRVYFRSGKFLLQWWEPGQRKNVAERLVEGDLVEAVARARQIEARLAGFGRSGRAAGRLRHDELVARFTTDLTRRADAGEVSPATVRRYASALEHYLAFVGGPEARRHPHAGGVDRTFTLSFAAFLAERRVAPNGLAAGARRRMTACAFVWDAVRAMFRWAADPERGDLLGDGFRNPFLRRSDNQRARHAPDPFGQPDITVPMAAAFLAACDDYQLRLFVPLVFLGLRAAEPCFLFREYVEEDAGTTWLRVPCNPALAYSTKGRRDKRLPLAEPVRAALLGPRRDQGSGLLLVRRGVAEERERPPLLGASLARLEGELESRLRAAKDRGAATCERLRDAVLADAGGVGYDRLEGEFRKVSAKLGWPAAATPKDFRHLFATSLANAGLPEPYRKYLMGHAPSGGREGAIAAYTHLDRLAEQYARVVAGEWAPLVEVLGRKRSGSRP